jgi:hypothetical protein
MNTQPFRGLPLAACLCLAELDAAFDSKQPVTVTVRQ